MQRHLKSKLGQDLKKKSDRLLLLDKWVRALFLPLRRFACAQPCPLNVKRVLEMKEVDWTSEEAQSPYLIRETQEVKTTWHPVGL